MKHFSIAAFIVSFLCGVSLNTYSQQTNRQRDFLGASWSTKSDTSIKREQVMGWLIGDELKFFNFKSLYKLPWNFNIPQNTPFFEFNMEFILGNPSKFYLSEFVVFGYPDNASYPLASNIYSMELKNYGCFGIMGGHKFFTKWKHRFLKPLISAGLAYNVSDFVQNLAVTNAEYTLGNLLIRSQLIIEFPKGFYTINKKHKAFENYFTFGIKVGYDIPLQQERLLKGSGWYPTFNMGGWYLAASVNIWTHSNKELANLEWKERKKKT